MLQLKKTTTWYKDSSDFAILDDPVTGKVIFVEKVPLSTEQIIQSVQNYFDPDCTIETPDPGDRSYSYHFVIKQETKKSFPRKKRDMVEEGNAGKSLFGEG